MRALLLASLCLLPPLLHAQDGRQVRCRFLSFGARGPDASVIALSDKGAELTCTLSSSQLSAPVVCTARNNGIAFLSQDKKPVATAAIPSAAAAVLLIFVQTAKPGEPPAWKIMTIEDSPKTFPDGGAFVANFNRDDIRFVIGEHKGRLKPGAMQGYALPKERDDFNMAPVIFEFQQAGAWRIGNESSLRFLPGMRYLIFAFTDPASGRPKINTYQDFAAPAAPAAAPAG